MRLKIVRDAKKCIYKKNKGYLLLELVVGFAIVSIMLVCVWSSFSVAMNINTKALEKEKTFKILNAIEKEFNRNVNFDEVVSLASKKRIDIKSDVIKNIINIDFVERKIGQIEEVYVNFSDVSNGCISIEIYKEEYRVEIDKLECVKVK